MTVCPGRIKSPSNQHPNPYDCASRYCPVCGDRWQKDQRVMAVAAAEHVPDTVALVTVTAPGSAYFADAAWRWVGGPWRLKRWWNEEARSAWRDLHLWASRPLRGWAKKQAPGWRVLFRSWEYQKRGLLHLHLVLPYSTPEEKRVTDLYVWNLWSGARAHEFGYVMAGDTGTPPSWARPPRVKPANGTDAARYVCKYVASTGAGKEGMRDVAQRTAQRGSVLYVAPALTRRSGVTMTGLRNRRRIWARYPWARASRDAWEDACLVEAIQRGRPRLTTGAVLRIRLALSRTRAGSVVDGTTGELLPPVPAPPPPEGGRTPLPRPAPARRLVAVLAPVLLRDPEPAERSHYRTVPVIVGGV